MRVISFPLALLITCLTLTVSSADAKAPKVAKTKANPPGQTISIAYLNQQTLPPALSSSGAFEPWIKYKGTQGAELGIVDNNTTGKFVGQQFTLSEFTVPPDGDALAVFRQHIAGKFHQVIVNLPAKALLTIADDTSAKAILFLDINSVDDALRNESCRANVMHILPSRAMRADALAQYMAKKRWKKWFLLRGVSEEDALFTSALHRAAKRFGMEIIAEKTWSHDFQARRSAQSDVSVLTQTDDEYDVLVVADEQNVFGDYLLYRTWSARPVIGTQGLIATAWHSRHDQWGATQIQNRFVKQAQRSMQEHDYAAYIAIRALGEAATRTKSTQADIIKAFLLSKHFALQAYKGNPLSFRSWDGQLRQPILLAWSNSVVTVAPIEGFLHTTTELDTLGYDQPESLCKFTP